jgi:predicted Zn-dependent peptidase
LTPARFQIEQHTLSNGLRVVLQPDRSLPLVAINLWYHVGSKNEAPGKTGLAHLFEHMLFQGSQHVGKNDHFRLVQKVGGVANGSTWFDRTNYYETLPSHCLSLGLWLESDRMGFFLPALDTEKLENQREVVMNERRQRVENQPYGQAFERLNETLFPDDHPYRWPVIGYMEDIAAADQEDVETFFRTYYAPDNAVLTLAGHFDPDTALELVETYFGSLPRGGDRPSVSATLPDDSLGQVVTLEDDVQLPRVYTAFRLPPFGTPEWYSADLLSTALAGGKTSPLYRQLVYERQIAQDVSAFVLPTELASSFIVVATGRPDVELPEMEEVIHSAIDAAADGDFGNGDLERARNKLITSYSDQLQALDDRADLLSMFATYFDDPHRITSEIDRYVEQAPEDLARVARDRLAPEKAVTLRVVPR